MINVYNFYWAQLPTGAGLVGSMGRGGARCPSFHATAAHPQQISSILSRNMNWQQIGGHSQYYYFLLSQQSST